MESESIDIFNKFGIEALTPLNQTFCIENLLIDLSLDPGFVEKAESSTSTTEI